MKSAACVLALLVPFGLFAVAGCAVGEMLDDPSVDDYLSSGPVEAGVEEDDDEGTIRIPEPSESPDDGDDGDDQDAGSDAGGGDAGTGDAGGGDAGTGDAGGSDAGTGGTTISCASPNTCTTPAPTHLGNVSADTGASKVTAKGETSKFFTVKFTEDDSGIFGRTLVAWGLLTLPSSADFDLFVHFPNSKSTHECNVQVFDGKVDPAYPDERWIALQWGDTPASSDTRTLVFEVRHKSGTCKSDESWSLEIGGNVTPW